MELYDCKILIGGSRENEARKEAITAAEIIMLRHIHGEDSVLDIKPAGSSDISDAKVREALALIYGPDDMTPSASGPKILQDVFGPRGVALPRAIEGVEAKEVEAAAPKDPKIKPRHARDLGPANAEMFEG